MPGSPAHRILSVIVPCYNEEPVIRETHKRLGQVLDSLTDLSAEIIYVNDGSSDGTLETLKALQRTDPRVRVLSFSRNFGHQIAISAGIENASGDAIVLIDADLQDPPEVIPAMVERWRKGVDIVYGQREEREGETRFKLLSARLFYRIINRMSEVDIPLDTGDFRLIDRRVVKALLAMPEHDRFVRGMVAWTGFSQEPLPYKRSSRFAGTTKYPMRKMLHLAADGILSFSLAPLHLAIWMGVIVAAMSCIGIMYVLIIRLATHHWVPGVAMLFIALLFLGGVQMIFLGVIGEYLGRIYIESKKRPLYFVRERYGFDDTHDVSGSEPAQH